MTVVKYLYLNVQIVPTLFPSPKHHAHTCMHRHVLTHTHLLTHTITPPHTHTHTLTSAFKCLISYSIMHRCLGRADNGGSLGREEVKGTLECGLWGTQVEGDPTPFHHPLFFQTCTFVCSGHLLNCITSSLSESSESLPIHVSETIRWWNGCFCE